MVAKKTIILFIYIVGIIQIREEKIMELKKKAFICPIVFGIIMIIIGFCIQIPGGVLTTYSSLDGEKD